MGNFDPYQAWLDISSDQQPVTHYRLLGIREFETDAQTIAAAADRVANHLSRFQHGPQATECARLMQQVQTAKYCLLDSVEKSQYDAALRQKRQLGGAGGVSSPRDIASMYPPGWRAQEQQIGQTPPVPRAGGATAGSPERPLGQAPPVPTGATPSGSQERKLPGPGRGPQITSAPPVPGAERSGGPGSVSGEAPRRPLSGETPMQPPSGETPLRPPPNVPGRGPSALSSHVAPPAGQQIAGPGPPGASSLPPQVTGSGGSTAPSGERPLSGPAAGPGSGPTARSTPSRPMPRGASSPTDESAEGPVAPVGQPGAMGGGYPADAPFGTTAPGTPQPLGGPYEHGPEGPLQQPMGTPFPPSGATPLPGALPGAAGTGPQPVGQPMSQPPTGYGPMPVPGGTPPAMFPQPGASGPPVQPPGLPQGGTPSWAPSSRTGQVGTSVADAAVGTSAPAGRTTFAAHEGRRPRRKSSSSSTYQAMVIVFAAAIVLVGFVLALVIAHYVL